MKKTILEVILLIILMGVSSLCGLIGGSFIYKTTPPPPEIYITKIVMTSTSMPTYTPYPTNTLQEPQVVLQTVIVIPTQLPPTVTNIIPPTPAGDFKTNNKQAGNYLVGIDIAPGLWRNSGTIDGCYWEIDDKYGEIIANDFGMGGGTMYIPADAFSVEMSSQCGIWTYLGPP